MDNEHNIVERGLSVGRVLLIFLAVVSVCGCGAEWQINQVPEDNSPLYVHNSLEKELIRGYIWQNESSPAVGHMGFVVFHLDDWRVTRVAFNKSPGGEYGNYSFDQDFTDAQNENFKALVGVYPWDIGYNLSGWLSENISLGNATNHTIDNKPYIQVGDDEIGYVEVHYGLTFNQTGAGSNYEEYDMLNVTGSIVTTTLVTRDTCLGVNSSMGLFAVIGVGFIVIAVMGVLVFAKTQVVFMAVGGVVTIIAALVVLASMLDICAA